MSNSNTIVQVSDKKFEKFITHEDIQASVQSLASKINNDYQDKNVTFLVVLNGAFMFASDLLKHIALECEITFVRVSSYAGMQSTETVKEVLGMGEAFDGKHVIIVEDIIDTGITMEHLLETLRSKNALSIKTASLLFKKSQFRKDYQIDYIGFTIPNNFVVGYGLDYNGFGRNLQDIYTVID
jgi:hypoxanthine phosphoribosyltransferase